MKVQLSISLLVSDRADTLRKCLDSLKGLLRELPCELIVVFTGEKEETLEMVRQYTDHIIPFQWCSDFSAARNAGLREAKGEWFLYLDDDEWFENTEELLEFFKSGTYRNYQSAAYIQRNYSDFGGMDYDECYVDRLVRRTEDVHFTSSIHEYFQIDGGMLPQKHIHDFVHHYGYARISGADRKKDTRMKRNIPLLLEEFQKAPDNGKTCVQLAQEYRNEREFSKAEEYARKGLQAYARNQTIYTPEYWSMVQLPVLIEEQGERREALLEAERQLANPRRCELVEAYLYEQIVRLAKELHESQKGIEALRNFHKILQSMEQHQEETEMQGVGGLSLGEIRKRAAQAYTNGLMCAAQIEEADEALTFTQEIIDMIPWDRENMLSEPFYIEMEQWKDEYRGQNDEILSCFSRIDAQNPYLLLQKALYAESRGNRAELETFYQQCTGIVSGTIHKELLKLALRNYLDLGNILDGMSLEAWDRLLSEIVEEVPIRVYEENRESWKERYQDCPCYYLVLEQKFLMNLMLEKVLEGEQLVKVLKRFCENVMDYCRTLYWSEVFHSNMRHCLPPIGQFAFVMEEVLEMEEQRPELALRKLRKALAVYPKLRIVIKRMMEYIVKKSEKSSVQTNPEFAALGAQIKQAVRELLDNQQYREAEPVLGQLSMLLPEDMEVLKMKQILLQHIGC